MLHVESSENYCEQWCTEESDPGRDKLATVYCVDCQQKCCQACDDAHNCWKIMQSHKRVRAGDEVSSTNIQDHSFSCGKHCDKKIELYCIECKLVNCMMCFVEIHRQHDCVNISSIDSEFKQGLKDNIVSLIN